MMSDPITDDRLKELAEFEMPCIGGRGHYKTEYSRIAEELLFSRAEIERLKAEIDRQSLSAILVNQKLDQLVGRNP